MKNDEPDQPAAKPSTTGNLKDDRDSSGRFKAGVKRGGRRKGSRNRLTVLAERLINGEGEALVRKAIEMALEGNATMLSALLRSIVPPAKERSLPLKFNLPPLRTAGDAMLAVSAIAAGVASGDLDADAAKVLTALVSEFRATLSAVELDARLHAVEEKIHAKKS